jgi:hypothetical protein
MKKLRGLLALVLTQIARAPAFVSETSIQHLFVRRRLVWIRSQMSRGKTVVDVAKTLGVSPSIVLHELMMHRL